MPDETLDFEDLFSQVDAEPSSSEKSEDAPASAEADVEVEAPSEDDDGSFDDDLEAADLEEPSEPSEETTEEPEPEPEAPSAAATEGEDDLSELVAFMDTVGVQQETRVVARGGDDLTKPWMRFHRFVLVKSVDEVREIVDAAIKHGRCGLDLETEGFDNRIDYDDQGRPYTRHKIVGYCISVRGVGHYIPIGHAFDTTMGDLNPNLPVDEVSAEIKRLCLEAQPELTPEGQEDDAMASRDWVRPPRVIVYFWNAKFDQEFLYPVTGIDAWHPDSFEDGMLAAYTWYTDDKSKGLKEKAPECLSVTDPDTKNEDGSPIVYPYEMIPFEDLFPKGMKKDDMKFFDLYPEDGSNAVKYGCSDAICTELLCEIRRVKWDYAVQPATAKYESPLKLIQEGSFASTYRLEKQVVQAVRLMERTRTLIDRQAIHDLFVEAEAEKQAYYDKIQALAKSKGFYDFNPGSTPQLSEFLFGKNGLDINPKPKKNEASGQYKTDAATLEAMHESHPDIEVLGWVVKYRQIDKILGTYLTGMLSNCDEQNQLRFNFNQTGAATGRFTAPQGREDHGFSGIPIQGIPARDDPKKPKVAHSLRRMFIAHEGYTLAKIDYAGQELRIVTNLSKEPIWLKEFLEGTGDLHTITAQAFFGPQVTKNDKVERNMGKIANFSLIYGGGTQAIQRATKCDKVEAARRKANFDKTVQTFAKWVKKQHAEVKKRRGVTTAFGRFIRIPDANVKPGDIVNGQAIDEGEARRIRAGCERKSTNYPIQGSGADILKISLIRLNKELHRRGWLKNGGDDSVRIIMTVHDEIVFEIRHERLQEALPVICDIMESPSRLARWRVPLVVEPLVGLNWEAKYDWLEIMGGKKEVPDWLKPYIDPNAEVEVELAKDPSPARKVETLDLLPPDEEVEEAPATTPSGKVEARPDDGPPSSQREIVTFHLPRNYLTRESVRLVMMAVSGAIPIGEDQRKAGRRLRLLDHSGQILIDPKLGIHVDPQRFSRELRERNLGRGTWDVSEEP